jgi:hypothetical protein
MRCTDDYPPVTIRCPQCGAFLRELAHAAGSFTVVACGPCGETFRLTGNAEHPRASDADLPHPGAHVIAHTPRSKSRAK